MKLFGLKKIKLHAGVNSGSFSENSGMVPALLGIEKLYLFWVHMNL